MRSQDTVSSLTLPLTSSFDHIQEFFKKKTYILLQIPFFQLSRCSCLCEHTTPGYDSDIFCTTENRGINVVQTFLANSDDWRFLRVGIQETKKNKKQASNYTTVPKYFQQEKVQKLLLFSNQGYATSTICKQRLFYLNYSKKKWMKRSRKKEIA